MVAGRRACSSSLDKLAFSMSYSVHIEVRRLRLSEDLMLAEGFGCGGFLNIRKEVSRIGFARLVKM